MSEQKNPLTIEDEIKEKLTGGLQNIALDFAAYLKQSGLTVDATYSNAFRYLGEAVCVIALHPNYDENIGLNIYLGDYDSTICSSEYENFPVDGQLKEFAWAHKHTCGGCGCGNQPGKSFKILGKELDNVCTSLMWFGNPDADKLVQLKKLVDVWVSCIAGAKKEEK